MKNKTLIYGVIGVLAYFGYKKYSEKTPALGTSNKTTDDLKERIKMLENTAKSLEGKSKAELSKLEKEFKAKSKAELSKLQKEIDRREAEKQKRLAEIERLKGSKTADDILRKQNDDLQRKLAELQRQMGIKDAENKRILSKKEKELLDQIAKLKASITTKQDLIDTINAKRNAKVEMEKLKTLEDFIGNSQETIDRLTKTLDGIDTSTKAGQERAKVYIDLIKKAEALKLKKTTSKSTIIELGLGRTGYQQLLPPANWTLNDLLDDSKHIVIKDRFKDDRFYEFYPTDANVEFKRKGNWTSNIIFNGEKKLVTVFSPSREKSILSVVARNPKRYEVLVGGKSLDAQPIAV
jgi:DNA repair exonuclease SbcCD ATPase subunit